MDKKEILKRLDEIGGHAEYISGELKATLKKFQELISQIEELSNDLAGEEDEPDQE